MGTLLTMDGDTTHQGWQLSALRHLILRRWMNRKDGCETCQRLDAGQGVTPKRNIFDDEVGRDAVNRQSRKLLHPSK